MLRVCEVFADGHEDLTEEHLAYICGMANRTGFSVLSHSPNEVPVVALIKLKVGMNNPVFKARLVEQ